MKWVLACLLLVFVPVVMSAQAPQPPPSPIAVAPTPANMAPGSINCEDIPYPYPVSYLPLMMYGQDARMAYMDVPPAGQPNGHTVVLLHGMNFAGYSWGASIDVLRREGFRVVVPDQIGFGRSSKPFVPYNLHDMALNTHLILQQLKIEKAMIVGHSFGGMLAARFAARYPEIAERVVLYNPIGLVDVRYAATAPWNSFDENYKRTLATTYQHIHAVMSRYFLHNPSAFTPEFEKYVRLRYAWTLGPDWPRLAMVQTLLQQLTYLDPVVNDWARIRTPTLVFGGAEDSLAGPVFRERMKFVADTIPGGNGRLLLIPGLGHVPHVEAPEKTYPPLLAFLKEGL